MRLRRTDSAPRGNLHCVMCVCVCVCVCVYVRLCVCVCPYVWSNASVTLYTSNGVSIRGWTKQIYVAYSSHRIQMQYWNDNISVGRLLIDLRCGLPDYGLPQLLHLRARSLPLANPSPFLPPQYILYRQAKYPECAVGAVSSAASQNRDF